jgi:hypothetical protein
MWSPKQLWRKRHGELYVNWMFLLLLVQNCLKPTMELSRITMVDLAKRERRGYGNLTIGCGLCGHCVSRNEGMALPAKTIIKYVLLQMIANEVSMLTLSYLKRTMMMGRNLVGNA